MKKLFLILGLFLTFFPIVKAYPCSKEQITKFEKLASQIHVTYDYREVNDNVLFDINFHNVGNNFYIVDYYNFNYPKIYENDGNGIIVVNNCLPGNKYRFSILNINKLCDSKIISELYVTLPSYNAYYKDDICKDIGEFELCKKWVNNGNISYEQFLTSVKNYKKEIQKVPEEIDDKIEENLFNKIRNFIAVHYTNIIVIILVIVIVIICFVLRKKNRKYKW